MCPPSRRSGLAFVLFLLTSLLPGATAGAANLAGTTVLDAPDSLASGTAPWHGWYLLTVRATAGGSVSPRGTSYVRAGSVVTIQATPSTGYLFWQWTGVGSGSYTGPNRTATITVNGNITETANFQLNSHPLTMVANPGGAVTPSSGTYTYGTHVTIQAIPDSGYSFATWTGVGMGSYTGNNNPVTISINGPITQTATFSTSFTLTMAADPGGTVSPAPGVYTYGGAGTQVWIQAYPDSGEAFTGWTGTGTGSYTGSSNPVAVAVNGDVAQSAHFAPIELVPLTVIASPGGSVSPASGSYYVGTLVTIFAVPDVGWLLGGWVGSGPGSYTGQATGQTILIGGPITETANFVFPPTWPVTMTAGAGGTVAPASGSYPNGGTLQITATPNAGYVLKSWSGTGPGSYSGSANPATITVNGTINESATFQAAAAVTVTTSPAGWRIGVDGVDYVSPQTFWWAPGSLHSVNVDSLIVGAAGDRHRFTQWSDGFPRTSRNALLYTSSTLTAQYVREYLLDFQDPPEGTSLPGDGWYTSGSSVQITAVPDSGYVFGQWAGSGTGSYTGTANPATVTMNAPIVEAPVFRPLDVLGYEMTISASATDPHVNTGTPTGTVRMLYLWSACSDSGISAFEGDVTGDLPVLGFVPASGVLNAGGASNLFLAISGCAAMGPLLLGTLIVNDTGGEVCLGPSAAHGVLGAVDCRRFVVTSPQVTGFSSSGQPPCVVPGIACGAGAPAAEEVAAREPVVDAPAATPVTYENAFLGARPNPFAGQTELHFSVEVASPVRLSIYDVTGRLVRRVADEEMSAGEHHRMWDGRSEAGSRAAGGVYFVRLEVGDFRHTDRIVLTRSGE
jgi:hypothetical protein